MRCFGALRQLGVVGLIVVLSTATGCSSEEDAIAPGTLGGDLRLLTLDTPMDRTATEIYAAALSNEGATVAWAALDPTEGAAEAIDDVGTSDADLFVATTDEFGAAFGAEGLVPATIVEMVGRRLGAGQVLLPGIGDTDNAPADRTFQILASGVLLDNVGEEVETVLDRVRLTIAPDELADLDASLPSDTDARRAAIDEFLIAHGTSD